MNCHKVSIGIENWHFKIPESTGILAFLVNVPKPTYNNIFFNVHTKLFFPSINVKRNDKSVFSNRNVCLRGAHLQRSLRPTSTNKPKVRYNSPYFKITCVLKNATNKQMLESTRNLADLQYSNVQGGIGNFWKVLSVPTLHLPSSSLILKFIMKHLVISQHAKRLRKSRSFVLLFRGMTNSELHALGRQIQNGKCFLSEAVFQHKFAKQGR